MSGAKKEKLEGLGIPLGNSADLLATDSIGGTDIARKKGKKFLSAAFNMAAGFGATFAAKAVVTSFAAWTMMPAIGALLVSSFAVGVAATLVHHAIDKNKAKKRGDIEPELFTKKNAKDFAFSSGFALIGGALFLNFDTISDKLASIFSNGADSVSNIADATNEAVATTAVNTLEPEISEPSVVEGNNTNIDEQLTVLEPSVATKIFSCGDAANNFKDWTGDSNLSEKAIASLTKAETGSPQGVKDLGYFLFNGFGGVPENKGLAVEMFKCAATDGNVQAKVDFAYSMFHGLGQEQNKDLAFDIMKEVKGSARAEWFLQEWSHMGVSGSEHDVVVNATTNTHERLRPVSLNI